MRRSKALEGVRDILLLLFSLLAPCLFCLLVQKVAVILFFLIAKQVWLPCGASIEVQARFISLSSSLMQKSMALKLKDRECFSAWRHFPRFYLAIQCGLCKALSGLQD